MGSVQAHRYGSSPCPRDPRSLCCRSAAVCGSSPRPRGTAITSQSSAITNRFIPAFAGNRKPPDAAQITTSVHPRVRGEQIGIWARMRSPAGSSPRPRRTVPHRLVDVDMVRFIPASAGNSSDPFHRRCGGAVHPRVRGEKSPGRSMNVCGTGSSLRPRGTGAAGLGGGTDLRFIPASAGNRSPADADRRAAPVHPRVRGEQGIDNDIARLACGSSPRPRGTVRLEDMEQPKARFIPASAGNRCLQPLIPPLPAVHPRVRGEQTRCAPSSIMTNGSSPRPRGTGRLRAS